MFIVCLLLFFFFFCPSSSHKNSQSVSSNSNSGTETPKEMYKCNWKKKRNQNPEEAHSIKSLTALSAAPEWCGAYSAGTPRHSRSPCACFGRSVRVDSVLLFACSCTSGPPFAASSAADAASAAVRVAFAALRNRSRAPCGCTSASVTMGAAAATPFPFPFDTRSFANLFVENTASSMRCARHRSSSDAAAAAESSLHSAPAPPSFPARACSPRPPPVEATAEAGGSTGPSDMRLTCRGASAYWPRAARTWTSPSQARCRCVGLPLPLPPPPGSTEQQDDDGCCSGGSEGVEEGVLAARARGASVARLCITLDWARTRGFSARIYEMCLTHMHIRLEPAVGLTNSPKRQFGAVAVHESRWGTEGETKDTGGPRQVAGGMGREGRRVSIETIGVFFPFTSSYTRGGWEGGTRFYGYRILYCGEKGNSVFPYIFMGFLYFTMFSVELHTGRVHCLLPFAWR